MCRDIALRHTHTQQKFDIRFTAQLSASRLHIPRCRLLVPVCLIRLIVHPFLNWSTLYCIIISTTSCDCLFILTGWIVAAVAGSRSDTCRRVQCHIIIHCCPDFSAIFRDCLSSSPLHIKTSLRSNASSYIQNTTAFSVPLYASISTAVFRIYSTLIAFQQPPHYGAASKCMPKQSLVGL